MKQSKADKGLGARSEKEEGVYCESESWSWMSKNGFLGAFCLLVLLVAIEEGEARTRAREGKKRKC